MLPPLMPTLTLFHWMPSCRSTLRATSAILTCRFTWVGAATLRRFTTRVGSSTNWFATWTTFAACSALATVPVRTSDWSTVLALTDWPGAMLRMPSSSAAMLWVTRMRLDISTLSFSSTAKSVVSPTPTPVRYMSRGDFTSTSATSGLATKRLEKGSSTRMSWPVPTTRLTDFSPSGCTSSKAPSGDRPAGGERQRGPQPARRRGGDVVSLLSSRVCGLTRWGWPRGRPALRWGWPWRRSSRRARSGPGWSRSRRTRGSGAVRR